MKARDVCLGDNAAAKHNNITEVPVSKLFDHLRKESFVRSGEGRQAHGVDILLKSRFRDLGRGLMKTGVDHLEPGIAEGPGDHLGATIVSVKTWFCDENSSWHRRQRLVRGAMYGIMYGVKRTTIYLPDEMKTAVEREAARRGITEAEVIRDAVRDHLNKAVTPMHDLPVFAEGFGVEIATRVDELLEGMADELMDEM